MSRGNAEQRVTLRNNKTIDLRPCPHVSGYFWKWRFFFSVLAFRPHVYGVFDHWKRRFSKTLSRVEIFENEDLSYSCGRAKWRFSPSTMTSYLRSSPSRGEKNLRFQKYPDTCEQGLKLERVQKFHSDNATMSATVIGCSLLFGVACSRISVSDDDRKSGRDGRRPLFFPTRPQRPGSLVFGGRFVQTMKF